MRVTTGIHPDEITFGSNHILFVEGKNDSIDLNVLGRILPITVKPLGPSNNIKSTAQAFANVHPTYFFLIDRDHYDNKTVEKYWKNFPMADTPNLLIWRKKEIENYFLDSEFLCQSSFLDASKKEKDIQEVIIRVAKKYLYMAVVNQVIVSIREDFKENWIKIFHEKDDFKNKESSLELLLNQREFSIFSRKVSRNIDKSELKKRFIKYLELMTDGDEKLKWNKGLWRDMIPGKPILHSVLGTGLFKVIDRNNNILTGEEKETAIIKDLLSSQKKLPDDFVVLKEIIEKRIAN